MAIEAADHEAAVTTRADELNLIATATNIFDERTGGALSQSYSLDEAAG